MILQRLKYEWRQSLPFKLATFYLLTLLVVIVAAPLLFSGCGPNSLDLANVYQPPFFSVAQTSGSVHWLGTDQLGRDVWANLIYGCRTAFSVALPVMFLALVQGVGLGMAAAWFGNRGLFVSYATVLVSVLWLFGAWFYVFYRKMPLFPGAWPGNVESLKAGLGAFSVLALISIIALAFTRLLRRVPFLAQKMLLPFDELVLKTMEVLSSVPRLVLVLSFAAFMSPGIGNVVLLLSLTYWIGPARLVRAETLKIKQLPYVEAARASGLPTWRILWRYVLPNAAGSLVIAFFFGLSGLLGLEATLSFLGIGLPPETPSWGRMLAGARLNTEAWWLVVFPATFLCITILAIQACGQSFRKAIGSHE